MLDGEMLVEIRKAGFVNKGAELMLYAVLERVKKEFPDAKFVMETSFAPYDKRASLGFYQKPRYAKFGFELGFFFKLVPDVIKNKLGVIDEEKIDIVIDAAGFSYSDEWGARSSQELANSCRRWKKNGTTVILLPQAFGPFEGLRIQKYIKKAIDNTDLVFARERVSYEYIVGVVGKLTKLKMAPDFTNLIEGRLPKNFDTESNRFCLVPNYRMVDKTTKAQSEAYLPFMIKCAKYLLEKGQKPFVLVHEGANDQMLAVEMNKALDGCLPIVNETNPLGIKGILGASEGTIGSRFHGLVSALSQGVPALGTGWSHKYQALFGDYGFSEGLLDVSCSEQALYEKLDMVIEPNSKDEIKARIQLNSRELKAQSERMWGDVLGVLKEKTRRLHQ